MPADNRAALAAATRQRARDTRARARAAIRQLDHQGLPVTFTAVAAAAKTSRSLLYRDANIRAEIQRPHAPQPNGPATSPCSSGSPRSSTTTAPCATRTANYETRSPRYSANNVRRALPRTADGHGPSDRAADRPESVNYMSPTRTHWSARRSDPTLQITTNLAIKHIKRVGRGFTNIHNYRLRLLLHCGGIQWQDQPAARLRGRRPQLAA